MHSKSTPQWRTVSILRDCLLIGLICITAAACGAQSGKGNHPAAGASPSGTQVGEANCTASQLDVALDTKSAGVAAGTSLVPIDFTNVAKTSCRLAGFAYVSFATGRTRALVGAAATADRSVPTKTLQLKAGRTAHLWLRVGSAANLPAHQCRPRTVTGLELRLPGQPQTIFIAHRFRTCAKRVQGTDLLIVEPFQPGRAHSGTAQ